MEQYTFSYPFSLPQNGRWAFHPQFGSDVYVAQRNEMKSSDIKRDETKRTK
jgi:hypothetical protein